MFGTWCREHLNYYPAQDASANNEQVLLLQTEQALGHSQLLATSPQQHVACPEAPGSPRVPPAVRLQLLCKKTNFIKKIILHTKFLKKCILPHPVPWPLQHCGPPVSRPAHYACERQLFVSNLLLEITTAWSTFVMCICPAGTPPEACALHFSDVQQRRCSTLGQRSTGSPSLPAAPVGKRAE